MKFCHILPPIRQRDIAVGPNKIQGIALQSGLVRLLVPAELMQGNVGVLRRLAQRLFRNPVNMNLPVYGLQRRKVVTPIRLSLRNPGQAVAAMNIARFALR